MKPSSSRPTRRTDRRPAALAAIPSEFEGIHRGRMIVATASARDSAWYAVINDDWPAVKTALEQEESTPARSDSSCPVPPSGGATE